jgi:hypothetical protein
MTSANAARIQLRDASRKTMERLTVLDGLIAAGWRSVMHGSTVTVSVGLEGSAEPIGEALSNLQPLVTFAMLKARWGGDSLSLEAPRGTAFVVAENTHGDLRETFDDDVLSSARQAFAGDVSAAIQLRAHWTAEFTIDPAAALHDAQPDQRWMVINDVSALTDAFDAVAWWELRPLVQPGATLVVALRHADASLNVGTQGLLVCSLAKVGEGIVPPVPATDRSARSEGLPHLPDPSVLFPAVVEGERNEAEQVATILQQRSTAACWALLATDVTTTRDEADLEFFGLRRQSWTLDRGGPRLLPAQHAAAYDLWNSVASAGGPDRALAVRQVVSIYREPPWAHAADVSRSAEGLFLALRADAIGEAFRSQREARALALSVARQTAEATTSLAKNAVERALAVFAAVGGIIVARTTKTLTADQATSLRHLLGIYLLVLVPWSFLLEGRSVTMAIGALKRDLATFSDLVPTSEQNEILQTATVRRAHSQAWIARAVVPLAYGAAVNAGRKLRGNRRLKTARSA